MRNRSDGREGGRKRDERGLGTTRKHPRWKRKEEELRWCRPFHERPLINKLNKCIPLLLSLFPLLPERHISVRVICIENSLLNIRKILS